jgi:hypothetical protein
VNLSTARRLQARSFRDAFGQAALLHVRFRTATHNPLQYRRLLALSTESLETLTEMMRKLDEVARLAAEVRPHLARAIAAARELEQEEDPSSTSLPETRERS